MTHDHHGHDAVEKGGRGCAPLAAAPAGPSYPAFGPLLSPMSAAAALSPVSVIGDALRFRSAELD